MLRLLARGRYQKLFAKSSREESMPEGSVLDALETILGKTDPEPIGV